MFTAEELRGKKKFEVLQIAKELGVQRYKGKSELTKEEIITKIIEKENGNEKTTEKDTSVSDKEIEQIKSEFVEEESKVVKAVKEFEQKQKDKIILSEEEREAKRKGYIDTAAVGTLVAFKSDTGKVKSAKIVKRSTKNRKFKVETAYGAEYIISFDDVIWVRTNKRWPKGVYNLLKGIEPEVN